MGILDNVSKTTSDFKSYIQNPLRRDRSINRFQDFKSGFVIEEIASKDTPKKIALVGNQMPFQPLSFGGDMKVNKFLYPGNPEPAVQVMQPNESNVTVNGRLKAKRFANQGLRTVPSEISDQLDAIRLRGNMLKITVGEWVRYGYLIKTNFDMIDLSDINYSLEFLIYGLSPPDQRCQVVDTTKEFPLKENDQLIQQAQMLELERQDKPAQYGRSAADIVGDAVNAINTAINAVTSQIEALRQQQSAIREQVDRLDATAQRAQREIFRARKDIGQIDYSAQFGQLNIADQIKAVGYTQSLISTTHDQGFSLQSMRERFAALKATNSIIRYRVKTGDTLQKIGIRFFQDASRWESIRDHNRLVTTVLTVGQVLEIPRE